MLSPFHSTYLASQMRPNTFLKRGFGDVADRKARARIASERRIDPKLLEELARQDARLPKSEQRRANLAALALPGTIVVATGQQVGLFTGPLYTLYKAASTVAIARAISAETGVRCVPLFWLQTEDHDFAEIASCVIARDRDPLKLSLMEDPARARVSIAHRTLGPEIVSVVDALRDALAGQPHASEVLDLIARHYRPAAPMAQSFAGVLAELFAADGLVIYDPRQPTSARLLVPVARAAILESESIDALLEERGQALRAAGFKEQIPLRPGSPLVFFHPEGPIGPRYRLVRNANGFGLAGASGSVSESELLATLEREPMGFSTSALLRPIAQDTLFPTVAYVGGPAEVDYFAQLEPIFSRFDLEPPLVARRASFTLVPPQARRALAALELTVKDLELPREALWARLTAASAGDSPHTSWAKELEARLDELTARVDDAGVTKSAARTKAGLRRSLEKLARRHRKIAVARDTTVVDRLDRAAQWLRPYGAPQERVHTFVSYAAAIGIEGLCRALASRIDPFDPTSREVEL